MKISHEKLQSIVDTLIILKTVAIAGLVVLALLALAHLNTLETTNNRLTLEVKNLGDQNKQLSKQIKQSNDSIHAQISCIFLFFTQPQAQRNNSSVTIPPDCITSSSSGGATGGTKSTVSTTNPAPAAPKSSPAPSGSSGGSNNPPPPSPSPPKHPIICMLTIGLLGCH